jgi:hypothetical protein
VHHDYGQQNACILWLLEMLGHAGTHTRATEWQNEHQRGVESKERKNWWKQHSQAHSVATKGSKSMSECMHGDKKMLGAVARDRWIN